MLPYGFSLAGLLVGVAIGATGVGGGSLMTPLLILGYGVAPAVAVGTDLLFAAASKSFAVLLHGRNGAVDWRIVGTQAAGSVPAVLLTLILLRGYGDLRAAAPLIKQVLAGAVVVTAAFTLFQEPLLRRLRGTGPVIALAPAPRRALTVASGVLIGALVTISSVGAGVIGMMVLLWLYPDRSPQRLVGSDLAHAVLVTAIAGFGHAGLGTVHLPMLLALLAGALPGVWLGTRLSLRLDALLLRRSIAGLLLFAGGTALAQTLS